MNSEAKKAWTDALRSGEYEQTIGMLSDGVGYCCLGVACEVAIKHGVDVEVYDGPGHFDQRTERLYDGNDTNLPPSVADWLGVDLLDLHADYGDAPEVSLIDLNDGYLLSFREIADIIEEQL